MKKFALIVAAMLISSGVMATEVNKAQEVKAKVEPAKVEKMVLKTKDGKSVEFTKLTKDNEHLFIDP